MAQHNADDNTVSLIKDYMGDCKQCVKLAGTFPPWLPIEMNSPGINPGASIVQHIYERSSLRH